MVRLLRSAHKAESASTEPLRPRVPVTSRATRTPQLKQGGSMDSGVVQDGEGKVVGERVEDSVGEGKSPATDIKLETLGADTDAYTPALLKETSIISETGSLHGASTTSASRESAVGSSSNDSISLNGTVNIGREASDLVLGFLPRNGMQHRVNATFDSEAVTQEAASTSSLPWSGNGLSDKAEGKQKRKQGDVSNDEHSSECPRKRVKHVVDALDSGHSSLTASAHSSTQYSLPVEDILLNNGLFPLEDRPGQNPLSDKNCISEVCGRNGGWMEWETEGERHARQKEDAATKAAYVFLTKKWAQYSDDILASLLVAAKSPRACRDLFKLVPRHIRKALAEGISGACPPLFDDMPVEVAQVIFHHMDVKSLARLSETSKRVYRLVSDADVWRAQAEKYGYTLPTTIPEGSNGMKHTVMKLFRENKLAEKNWLTGNYRCTQVRTESAGVYCVQYDDTKIVSGSRDRRIRIWDPTQEPPGLIKSLNGHLGSVLCLQFDHEKIISGSSDTSLRGWDIHTGALQWVVEAHGMSVLNLQFDDTTLVTCSKDAKVIVWDINGLAKPVIRYTLEGHAAPVNVVRFDSRFVVSASGDSTVKVWDLHTSKLVRTMEGHTRGIACLCFQGNLVVTGSSDESIKLWDVTTGECLRTFNGHTDLVRCIYMDGNRIVSGGYDKTIRVWDIDTGYNVATFREHRHRVFKVQFDRFRMVSSSHDDNILIWNFTGPAASPPRPLPRMTRAAVPLPRVQQG